MKDFVTTIMIVFQTRLRDLLDVTYETGWLAGQTEALRGSNRTPEFDAYQVNAITNRNNKKEALVAWVERRLRETEHHS